MFERIGLNKPESSKEWLGVIPLLLIFVVGAILILSFPLCIFGVFVQLTGDWFNFAWLVSAGETITTVFAWVAAIAGGTLGIL